MPHERNRIDNYTEYKKARRRPLIFHYRDVRPNETGVETLEGYADGVDPEKHFIMLGSQDEEYPIKKDIFNDSYEPVEKDKLPSYYRILVDSVIENLFKIMVLLVIVLFVAAQILLASGKSLEFMILVLLFAVGEFGVIMTVSLMVLSARMLSREGSTNA